MKLADADFVINSDRLVIGRTEIENFDFGINMEDGFLEVSPIAGDAGDGTIEGEIVLDARKDIAALDVDSVLDDIPMPNLGGSMEFSADLEGEGQSVAEIMAGLDGLLLAVVKDGTIANSFVTSFGTGLFSFSGSKDTTELECGILRMDIDDGIANFDQKLAAQMSDVTWRGGGEINLRTEKLGVGITPIPRKGIGLSAGTLASLVYIGGTLKNPSPQINPKDVAVKYGKYMAYLSTGGLSLLAEALYNKARADKDVCAQILDGTVFDDDLDAMMEEAEAAEETATE